MKALKLAGQLALVALGAAVAYAAVAVLSIRNVTGLQGPAAPDNPFRHTNRFANDFACIAIVAVVLTVVALARRRLHVGFPFIGGAMVGLIGAAIAVLIDA